MICERPLLDGKNEYLIERAVKRNKEFEAEEILFDYAICIHCAMRMTNELSDESLANIQRYLSENISFSTLKDVPENEDDKISYLMSNCLVKGVNKLDTTEYQVVVRCKGDEIIKDSQPYMLSAEALSELSEMLSNKTRDRLDDFTDTYFGGPPEVREILKKKNVFLV
jgi:hypothetical protein